MTTINRTQKTESNINLMKRLLAAGYSKNSIVARFCRRYRARYGEDLSREWVAQRVDIYARIAYKDVAVRTERAMRQAFAA